MEGNFKLTHYRHLAFASILVTLAWPVAAQSADGKKPEPTKTLEQKFFAALRSGNSKILLSYIPESGANVGSGAQHATKDEIEKQLQQRRGVYCKLFDSSCLSGACSYRELLTRSDKVRTAASEVTRNGVQQAVLVARVQNQRCTDQKLIDFIFNRQGNSWKLFSIP